MASGEIKLFHNDDSAYSRWVERYGGYVLTAKTRGGGFSLHTVDCYHLGPYKDGSRTTRKPRRWASSAQPLRSWARVQTGEGPFDCMACMHRTS
jgi:hypothetical protein